ncbi:MAG: aminotransferase class V-fold PLP-dependent enzyme [Phycisphaerales bacterium]
MWTRRAFLKQPALTASGALAMAAAGRLVAGERLRSICETIASTATAPDDAVDDEPFWGLVAQAFTVDRSLVNLNNGGVSPSPRFVQDAMKRHLDFSNQAPPYTMWKVLEPQREAVRSRLARAWKVSPEEIALTRNASEGLQILQFGFDLKPGDEVLTTNQDYPRMINTFKQRERRDGIVLRQFSIPIPAEDPSEIVSRFEHHITPRTRLILMCHMINLTGQILPVREITEMARRHGIPVLVDGAHSLAHFDFGLDELGCDYFATSLHKWLFAPHGTGLLFVRHERIAGLWPLMAAPDSMDEDIRKFEEIGTHPAANALAIAEALTFHESLGAARKAARLRYLRRYWTSRAREVDRVRLHTSDHDAYACGIATVQVEGLDSGKLSDWLWNEHRILTTPIKHDEFEGIRVSPSVYTTLEELDRFGDSLVTAARNGIPDETSAAS